MRVVHERCAGLDVHKSSVVACAMVPEGKQLRAFGTTTPKLEQLASWLRELGVSSVAMESSGIYWRPVFNLLEEAGFELLVANIRHMKAVPGRKTDVKDAEWIADLHRHGLLKASFIPSRPERELRDLVRYRRSLIEQRAHEVQRVHKLLEAANIKLEDVISDVMGVNGRRFLTAMLEPDYDPEALAAGATHGLQRKRQQLTEALTGRVGEHQRFLLPRILAHIEFIEQQIVALDAEVAMRTRPFELPSPLWTRSRASVGEQPRRCWPKLGPTCPASPATDTWPPGPRSARATTNRAANGGPATAARATAGSRPLWSTAPGAQSGPGTATSALSTTAWPPAVGRSAPS